MRKEFIQADTRYQAKKAAPWAASIVKVEGGFMAFESVSDAQLWKSQK